MKSPGTPEANRAGSGALADDRRAVLLQSFFLFTFSRLALRHPVLCIRKESLVIYGHGGSSLDNAAGLPGIFRIAWLIVSRQGFRMQTLDTPWETFTDAQIGGVPMAKRLTPVGALCDPATTRRWPINSPFMRWP